MLWSAAVAVGDGATVFALRGRVDALFLGEVAVGRAAVLVLAVLFVGVRRLITVLIGIATYAKTKQNRQKQHDNGRWLVTVRRVGAAAVVVAGDVLAVGAAGGVLLALLLRQVAVDIAAVVLRLNVLAVLVIAVGHLVAVLIRVATWLFRKKSIFFLGSLVVYHRDNWSHNRWTQFYKQHLFQRTSTNKQTKKKITLRTRQLTRRATGTNNAVT